MQSSKASDFKIDIAADLHKWRAFIAIGELGSLTRAALFLDSNQSLLSRQLNALERECGARLFNRTGRGVELSETGARLFPQVKALLADAERLENEIRGEAKTPSGRVTLGSLPSIGMPLVGRLFSRMRAQFPASASRCWKAPAVRSRSGSPMRAWTSPSSTAMGRRCPRWNSPWPSSTAA